MRRRVIETLLPALAIVLTAAVAASQSAPKTALPDSHDLLQRALANEKKLAAQRERYACTIRGEAVETDSQGKPKKTKTEVKEQFFVNGISIERELARDGKDLTPEETRKEDQRVMKQTLKYSDPAAAQKESDKQDRQIEDFLSAMMLANGRRERSNGRSVLYYDILPNPKFQARNLNQRFAQVMQGKISIDEETGEVIDLNIKSVQDLKIGGGLLANLHKGFWLHVHNQPQADGVWMTDLAEGSGDARAALFLHPFFRFKQTTGDCHLYTAEAAQVVQAKKVK